MPPKKKQTSSTNKKKKKKASSSSAKAKNAPPVAVPDPLPADRELALDALVGKLWPDFVPESILSSGGDAESLKQYLKPVLFGEPESMSSYVWSILGYLKSFFFGGMDSSSSRLLQGLCSFLKEAIYSGQLRWTLATDTEPFNVLILVCQWKLLRKTFGFQGDDDLVEIVLKLGANVNDRLGNGTNALFFAVKYGTIRTVDLLLNAGINIRAVDQFGRTCLYNALEHPQPDILERLLQTLPATEIFRAGPHRSAADVLLENFTAVVHDGPIRRAMPTSWLVLGRPSVDNIARTLAMVLQKGSEFTNAKTLSLAYSGFERQCGIAEYWTFKESSRQLKIIGSFLLGMWLPDSLQKEVVAFDEKALSLRENIAREKAKDECAICLSTDEEDGSSQKKKIELYCGHGFCVDCIVDYGKRQASRAWCPTCRRPLCLELCNAIPSGRRSVEQMLRFLNIDTNPLAGPFVLKEEQVLQECRARKISASRKTIDELRRALVVHRMPKMEAELGATKTMQGNELAVLAPKNGLVVIPIVIKSIPVLACVSTRSPCTVVSSEFVAAFGLKKKNLKTDRFRDMVGKKYKSVSTALHEFEFTIGGIAVQLDSAVETSNLPVGIQLGFDFLMSAAYW